MTTTKISDAGKFRVIPNSLENDTWLVGQSMAADTDYESVDCRDFGTVWLEFIMSPTSDPVGTLFIEWSMDDVIFYPFAIDPGKFSVVDAGIDLTVTEAEGKIAVADPAAETRFSLGIEKPPPFMRGRWDDTTGGSATGMSGTNFGRG